MLEASLGLAHLAEEIRRLHLLLGRVDDRLRLVVVIEECKKAIILLLRKRIELVSVTLGALDGQAEDAFTDAVHAIDHGVHAELLGIHAAFFVEHRVPQEAGGDDLVLGAAAAVRRRQSAR